MCAANVLHAYKLSNVHVTDSGWQIPATDFLCACSLVLCACGGEGSGRTYRQTAVRGIPRWLAITFSVVEGWLILFCNPNQET